MTISPSSDTPVITRAVYTVSKGTCVIAGTDNILAGQTVTAHLGLVTGPVIGTAVVDAAGAFQVKAFGNAAVLGSQVTVDPSSAPFG